MPWGENPLVTFETKIQFNLRETLPVYIPSIPTLQCPRRARLDSLQSQIRLLESYTVSMLASTKALIGTGKKNTFFLYNVFVFHEKFRPKSKQGKAKLGRWPSVAVPVSVSDYPPFSKHLGPLPSTRYQCFLPLPPYTGTDCLVKQELRDQGLCLYCHQSTAEM